MRPPFVCDICHKLKRAIPKRNTGPKGPFVCEILTRPLKGRSSTGLSAAWLVAAEIAVIERVEERRFSAALRHHYPPLHRAQGRALTVLLL
jgi:hypothetical protein